MSKKAVFAIVCAFGLATFVFAQGEKKAPAKKGIAILQPQMAVETGSFSAPAGKLGQKTGNPWSATTVGAAVDGKPNSAQTATLVGEILDFSCYLQVGKHGEKHRACGQKCFTAGQPIGLLTEDGNLYMLMEEEHDPRRDGLTEFRKAAIEHAAHIMEVTGTLSSHAGYKALYVTGYLKK
ncbi:MAG: hypothetical protein HY013_03360 [Candidatus Solibacter usitatus]|nr:hypothetical protein [Candidatus Solibacter usitatus]